MTDHAARKHSELGASISLRWWNCPGSVALCRGAPNYETEHSRRGTAAHEVAQLCFQQGQDAVEYVGRTVAGVEIDDKIADGVQVYLDDCRALGPNQGVLPSDVMIEVQFDLAQLDPPAPMFGTADFVAYCPLLKKLWVKDYKNGFLHVDESTPQLKYYAIGAMLALGKPVETIEVTICQPNGRAEAVRRVTYDMVELTEWSVELMEHARATQAPDAPLVAGPWCEKTFCPRAADCPARAAAALEAAQMEFAVVVSPRDTAGACADCGGTGHDYMGYPGVAMMRIECGTCRGTGLGAPAAPVKLPEIRLLTNTEKGAILARLEAVGFDGWVKDIRASLLANAVAGRDTPGWKAVTADTNRRWKSDDDTVLVLESMHGVDPWERKILSPAKAEAALAETLPGKTKKARTEAARAALADLTTRPPGAPILVPAADPRPALPAPGSEFSALPATTEKQENQ